MRNWNHIFRVGLLCLIVWIMHINCCAQSLVESGIRAVDLGLSVKWANINVGATTNFDYGSYFSWGEIKDKRYYGIRFPYAHYRMVNKGLYYKKYNSQRFRGSVVDNLSMLERGDDAAAKSWGGKWRMPTSKEIGELLNLCTWEIVCENGHHGFRVTGPNGNYIILPFGGYRNENYRMMSGTEGYYWSKELDPENPRDAQAMHIQQGITLIEYEQNRLTSQYKGSEELISLERSLGCLIRPVRTDEK